MRPRFGAAADAYNSYQPESYAQAEYPSNRKYYYFGPSQEQRGICSIASLAQGRAIPAVHLTNRKRPPPPPPQQQGMPPAPQVPLKHWATMTKDADAILATAQTTQKSAANLKLAEARQRAGVSEEAKEVVTLMTNSSAVQQSHLTDFIRTCIYGHGGNVCSSVDSELLQDGYVFLARRGYCTPIAITSEDASKQNNNNTSESSSSSSGGTVRATFASLLNPLLDPTMSCPAINNMLPQELRIFRAPVTSREKFEEDGGAGSDNENNANDAAAGASSTNFKASSSSAFLFSKNSKVFKIKALRAERMEKPVRRGATVTMGGRLVPSQGGVAGGGGGGDDGKPTRARGRKAAGAVDAGLDGFGDSGAPAGVVDDEFALVDAAAIGLKRGRDGAVIGENAPVDDGGDGNDDANDDADTNSLSSFSGDDDDNEDMSDGGGSGDELYL